MHFSVITLIQVSKMVPTIGKTLIQEHVMATKKLKKKVQRKSVVRKAENPVTESAREIWLAGLGAFSVAQQEGEKFIEEGNKFFDKLVKEGSKLEKRTRKDVEGAFDGIRGDLESRVKEFRGEVEDRVKGIRGEIETRVKDISGDFEDRFDGVRDQAGSVRKQANDNWDKLENIFDDRVGRVLGRLGIPTRDDVNGLTRRVQELSRKVAALDKKLNKARPAAKKAAPKKAVAKKPAAKKPAAKKPVAKKAVAKKPVAKKAVVKKAAVKKAVVKKPVAKKAAPAKEAPKAA
jgi:poly(hydroxyalkanoate) granule-associated protein